MEGFHHQSKNKLWSSLKDIPSPKVLVLCCEVIIHMIGCLFKYQPWLDVIFELRMIDLEGLTLRLTVFSNL